MNVGQIFGGRGAASFTLDLAIFAENSGAEGRCSRESIVVDRDAEGMRNGMLDCGGR
jgi:hypothetical protein